MCTLQYCDSDNNVQNNDSNNLIVQNNDSLHAALVPPLAYASH